jgi:type II secretory pathway pseudopilin PulG
MPRAKTASIHKALIVLALPAIVAAIAVPWWMGRAARAEAAAIRSDLHTVRLFVEDWAAQNGGRYPDSAAQLGAIQGIACEDRADPNAGPSAAGVVSYADSCGATYNLKARLPGSGELAVLTAVSD